MNKARDDIFQVLEDIPQQIQRAERAVKAQRTEQLKAIAVELYVKILETLGYVLQWYKENLPGLSLPCALPVAPKFLTLYSKDL